MPPQNFTDLPFELFWMIVESLECERDINALSQVNQGLYSLLNPHLYRMNIYNPFNPAIAWGAYHGQEATVRKALKYGACTESNSDGESPMPITLAALGGHANIVKLFLDHGDNPVYMWGNDEDGRESRFIMDWYNWDNIELYPIRDWPPWTAALAVNNAEVLQVLIEHNGFVPRAWDFFNTADDGHFDTLRVLVGACPKWADLAQSKYPAILGRAIHASRNNLGIARFLIESGSPVNYMDDNQMTALAVAANSGNIETVRLLLDRGADPATSLWPLRFAAERGHVEIAELLLERIDVQGKITGGGGDQFWVLYSAAACGFEKIVRACLDAGCNANDSLHLSYCPFRVHEACRESDDGCNLTPLDWARERGHSAVVRLLENEGSSNMMKTAD